MLLASARKPSFTGAGVGSSAGVDATGGNRERVDAGRGGEGVGRKRRRVAGTRGDDSEDDSGGGSGGEEEEEEDDVFGLCSEEMCTIAACLCVQVRGSFQTWG